MIEYVNSFFIINIAFITNTEYVLCYKYSDGFRNTRSIKQHRKTSNLN